MDPGSVRMLLLKYLLRITFTKFFTFWFTSSVKKKFKLNDEKNGIR